MSEGKKCKKVKHIRKTPRETIATIMMMDHGKVVKALKTFERSLEGEDLLEIVNTFNALKNKLDKHFDLEEQMIFDHIVDPVESVQTDLIKLLNEHKMIMESLEAIWKELEEGKEIPSEEELKAFLIMLKGHAKYEDNVFYPRLDKELAPEQKKHIIVTIIDAAGYHLSGDDDGSL